ncbi:MAG: nucleoside-diphosphate sugar epimerase/dehydratase, partial [Vicinamibacterales bacterium]
MVKRHNRLLVAFHIITDAALGMVAFVLAYFFRFETGLIPAPKGQPPFAQYLDILPIVAIVVPLAFHMQGLYRLRRGRSRIDDFFNVLVGSIIAVVLGVVVTLYVGTYYTSDAQKALGAYQVSQWGWAVFLVFNIALAYLSRKLVREALERRWIAGVGLRRILIAGAGELGRMVADRVLEHRELGYQIIGFLDDRAGGDHLGYRGLPLLGRLEEAAEIVRREHIDHLYVALPLEEHMKLLDLVEST